MAAADQAPFQLERSLGPAGHSAVRSAAEVDRMLERGDAHLCRSGTKSDGERSARGEEPGPSQSEHWTAIARFDLLDAFFTAAPPKLVASPFADLAWERYSSSPTFRDAQGGRGVDERDLAGGASVCIEWTREHPWMYFYNAPPGVHVKGNVQCAHEAPANAPQHPTGGADGGTDGSSSAAHMSSANWAPTPEEWTVAAGVSATMPIGKEDKEDKEQRIERLAKSLSHLRRNLSVTCAQGLWPLRWRATPRDMHMLLIKDLEKTWKAHPADKQREVIVIDYKLLDAAKPLARLVQGLELPRSQELVKLFEARCAEVASYACWVAADG